MSTPVMSRSSAPIASTSTRALLALGAVLVAMSAYRWGVSLAAWVAPVPFLLVMRRADGWRPRLLVLAVLAVATFAQVLKIITAPLPWTMAIPFALPSALTAWLVLLATETARRRAGELAGVATFVALSGLGEWLTFAGSPLGVWGTAASTQVDNLALLQLASVLGVAGIGLVVALVPATIAMLLGARATRARVRAALATAALVGGVHAWGAVRLFAHPGGPTVRVAAVVTDVGPGVDGLPSTSALAANEDELFARTRTAAARGAQVIVWNEVATVVEPADEPRLIARGVDLARTLEVELVLAYGVLVRAQPPRFDNKYVWLGADGAPIETYRKHHPVPGEPSLRGTAPLIAHDHPWGRGAGAICYDYDFPATARAHGRLGAGLVVVPSSDWRGIDPYHTQIARIGAISGGFSLVRSVRWATSAAYDAYGRTRATMAADEGDDHVMLATVPVTPVPTIYARVGDAPVVALGLALLAAVAGRARRRRRTVAT
ncbi:MAG: hypothetical protein IPL61_24445 [Myxococcales bacterium]|nr:hypothetical protein [Myxococcales bacterium]